MKNWQESRNYRRIKDEQGQVVARIITVDGVDVEVTEELFLAYSQADRRERYLSEDTAADKLLSLEQMAEDEVQPDYIGMHLTSSAEDEFLEAEAAEERERMKQSLLLALLSLNDADRELITALFFDGVSTREYARQKGVYQRAIVKRRDRILRDMKIFFEKFSD